ncbi:MAG: DUF5655 domain-containing protein [Hyphomicrobium sp.]|jgi:hypothetical protein
MAIDYGEKERQFLESLKTDTGRAVDEWMAAIAAAKLTHRNDVIDWLRRQGFTFSKASWLERIYNNGGRPVYSGSSSGKGTARPQRQRRTSPVRMPPPISPAPAPASPPSPIQHSPARPSAAQPEVPLSRPEPLPQAIPVPTPTASLVAPPPKPPVPQGSVEGPASAEADDAVMTLLAKAKAFRPLAQFVLAEIKKVAPTATLRAEASHVALVTAGNAFAVLAISPRELRLGLALAGAPYNTALNPAKFPSAFPGIPANITHMLVLTDARQVNDALIGRVKEAATARG